MLAFCLSARLNVHVDHLLLCFVSTVILTLTLTLNPVPFSTLTYQPTLTQS